MSRTHKGAKGPGWEPWSNKHEKEEQRAAYREPLLSPGDEARLDETCPGCRLCLCVKCGSHIVYKEEKLVCISCGHEEVE